MKQLIFFSILTSILSCSNVKNEKIDYIIFGFFCGECNEHCATMYKLSDNYLLRDTTDNYFLNRGKLNNGFFVGDTMNKIDFEMAKILIQKLPEQLRNNDGETFGEPDNRDQCGIYIQVKVGGERNINTIDTDLKKIPYGLQSYSILITSIILDIENNE